MSEQTGGNGGDGDVVNTIGEEELQRRNIRLAILSDAAADLLVGGDQDHMVGKLFEKIQSTIGLDGYFDFVLDEAEEELYLDTSVGFSEETARQVTSPEFGKAVCGAVVQTREPMVVAHVQASSDPQVELIKRFGIRSYACFPLVAGERLLGTLSFASRQVEEFDDLDLDFMRTISTYVSLAKERLRMDRVLREKERHLSAMFHQAGAGIVQADLNGRLVMANKRFCEMLGRTEEELLGLSIRDVTYEEDVDESLSLFDYLLDRKTSVIVEKRYVRGDGSTLWVQNNVSPILDEEGHPTHVLAFTQDITDRKQVEDSLRESAQRLHSLVDAATEHAIIGLSPSHDVTFWNDGAQRLLGYIEDEICGQSGDVIFTKEDREANQPELELAKSRAAGRAENERWHVRKDGTRFWGSGIVTPIVTEIGELKGYVKIFRDLTQAKFAEEALRESEERYRSLSQTLDERVRERTAELLQANEQLQGFTYSVAHDLRQQIRGISGNASMLRQDAGDSLDEDSKDHLQSLVGAAKQLSTLVDDLLAYARLAKQEPKRTHMDLSAIAREVVAYVATRDHCPRHARFEIEPGLSTEADPLMVRMVLENLLDNACKYSSQVAQPVIQVGREGDRFFVRDNGIGLDMRYAHKLFQPFERLHGGTGFAGTGIGLANVKRIVQKHGGEVSVDSAPGQGAVFYFTLA